jgi:hypothetical protein
MKITRGFLLSVLVFTAAHSLPADTHCGSSPGREVAADACRPRPVCRPSAAVPLAELGARAGQYYAGAGLAVQTTEDGARLTCLFQRLEGEVTKEGLWLRSTVNGRAGARFSVRAVGVGCAGVPATPAVCLPRQGMVEAKPDLARWVRPGLVEEYSVSMDGVRQDFIVTAGPARARSGAPQLTLELDVIGAMARQATDGVRLILGGSRRELAYSRLRVTDASGKELTGRIEAISDSRLAVVVDDSDALYPVRIDPTFSDANWVTMGGLAGTDGPVYAMAIHAASGSLYIGGQFTIVGTVLANSVAKWDGTEWSSLGSGINLSVQALAVDPAGNLYAGGGFTSAGGRSAYNLARWNGSTWSEVGSGVSGQVNALAFDGAGNLCVGGQFNYVNAARFAVKNIAKWNGSSWSALGSGLRGGDYSVVFSLALDGSANLYAGGSFTNAGSTAAMNVAKWDGSTWSAVGSGMNQMVFALAFGAAGDLYAGGSFTNAGGLAANSVARWNGSAWSALGSGMDLDVRCLRTDGSNVFAAGSFTRAGGVVVNHVAKWNGSSWSALGSGVDDRVDVLMTDGFGNLYAGGAFTSAGGIEAPHLAKWSGTTWSTGSSFTRAVDAAVRALVVDKSGDLYVGGGFTHAGGLAANYVAKWSGSTWSTLGSGTQNRVEALAMDDAGNLYAGGWFTRAGDVAANHIAKWDGVSWTPLGSGIDYVVYALTVDRLGRLYAGGYFTTAGGRSASNVAMWDGRAWSALGSGLGPGLNEIVYALASDSSNNVYAGGTFRTAGGHAVNNIAKWDGGAWSALGSGTSSDVNALLVDGSDNLYAGGYFGAAGGIAANKIAKWNGSVWSALGSGVSPNKVLALALGPSGDLYAAGTFFSAGGVTAKCIARWDGNAWSAMGSGMGGSGPEVYALAFDGAGRLYVGGYFTTVGGKCSTHIVYANLARTLTVVSEHGAPDPVAGTHTYGSGTSLTCTVSAVETRDFTRYTCTGWSGTGSVPSSGTGTNTGRFILTEDSSITWNWSTEYFLDTTIVGSGTVSGGDTWYADGQTAVASAQPAIGYRFSHWTGDLPPGAENPLLVTMDRPRAITAHFEISEYPLDVLSAHGMADPPVGTHLFGAGEGVVCRVTNGVVYEGVQATQYVCVGWAGSGSVPASGTNTNTSAFVMTEPSSVMWLWATNYWLSLDAVGGAIAGNDEGWQSAGANFFLTATGSWGYAFSHWEVNGAPQGAQIPFAVTMDQARNVRAVFDAVFVDVTGVVTLDLEAWRLSRQTGTYFGDFELCNRVDSPKALAEPFWYVVENSAVRRLMHPDGIDPTTGRPYVDVTGQVLAALPSVGNGNLMLDAGECVQITNIEFYSLDRSIPTGYVFAVWADPPAAATPETGIRDTDLDGLPDAWEDAAPALDKNNPLDADLDPDGDAFSNMQEYLADTDPGDADSFLRISEMGVSNGAPFFRWIGGVNATQYVEEANGPSGWTRIHTNAPPTDITNEFIGGAIDGGSRIFRVMVPGR